MTLDALATLVGTRLKEKGLALATAESCTGGWVAQVVTSVSGSSGWFDRGFVTYSNDAKREMIGVRAETLDRHGAVSEETAREMAAGALAASRAQIALAITGVAGPTGGTPQKPVGMVAIAVSSRDGAKVRTFNFVGPRAQVKFWATQAALDLVRRLLV